MIILYNVYLYVSQTAVYKYIIRTALQLRESIVRRPSLSFMN